MKLRFLLPLTLLCGNAVAADGPLWMVRDRVPYASLSTWQSLVGFQAYPDAKTGRILLERKNTAPLILLVGAPYALQGADFLSLPQAPRGDKQKILISAPTGERLFSSWLKGKDKEPMDAALEIARELTPPPPPLPPGPPPVVKKADAPPPAAPPIVTPRTCRTDHDVKRIFLDPGHGGDDLGTRQGRVKEKDIVLKFARLAAEELKKQGFEVSFSRSRDVFLPLDIRTSLASEWKADLFISLHVNSNPVTSVHGTETYILSPDATDAAARRLALLENSETKIPKKSSSAVQDILWDMEQNLYLQDSAYLASDIQETIVSHAHDLLQQQKAGDWKNRGVRQAPFIVLSRAAMPAVLVEIGYLSNSRDRKLLSDKLFQESLAKALAEGVKKYKDACRARP